VVTTRSELERHSPLRLVTYVLLPRVLKELRGRFDHFLKTGDDSKIPGDLLGAIYHAAVKYGGREEYEAMKRFHEKPKNPMQKSAAM
jgi:aminopeptidase 2